MHFTSPTWAELLTKFNPKMQYFKRGLDLNSKQKKGLKQLNFFNWLLNGSEYVRNVIQWC